MTSFMQKKETVDRKWYVIDAKDQPLGRVAAKAAHMLRGKHKPTYTPHIDCGDYIIIINAKEAKLTGNKLQQKMYYNHSMYPGGLRELSFEKLQAKKPEEIINHAVKGMLPKGKLGRQMFKKLKVYVGPEHAHAAQKPEVWEF